MTYIFTNRICRKVIRLTKLLNKCTLVAILLLSQAAVAQTETTQFESQKSVSEILNSDGTIKTGVSGSFNTVGYNLTYGENGAPVLTKSSKQNQITSTATWSSLPSGGSNGVNLPVYALAISGTDVYFGGQFTQLGNGTSANRIAKWDGTNWSTLTSGGSNGVNGTVYALAVSGTDIYVGGNFNQLGNGTSAKYIAKWDGTNWSTLPSGGSNGVNRDVWALAVSGTDIYVGGSFTQLGNGSSANRIAKWDGTNWSTLSSGGSNGVNNTVRALVVSGTDIYVGGSFTLLGDGTTSARRLAKWDGTSWSTLIDGSTNGASGTIWCSAINSVEGKMYVGGSFTLVGESTVASYVAKFGDSANPLPVELTSFTGELVDDAVELYWQTATEVNNFGFEVQKSVVSSQNSEDTLSGVEEWETIGFVQGHGTTNSPKQYSFTDPLNLDLTPNLTRLDFRLKQIDNDGTFAYSKTVTVDLTTITSVDDEKVYKFSLEQNYPNPFNPSTTIKFTVPNVGQSGASPHNIKLVVYNSLGQQVATLVNEQKAPGNYEVTFDAGNLSSGIYFYKLTSSGHNQTMKMIIIK